jgi:ATP-dependent DNA helicase RecG
MQAMNLPKPTFEQKEISAGLVRVTLQNDIRHRKVWVDKDVSEILGFSISSSLNETEKRIVNFIAEHENISVSQTQRLTGKSWHTCKKILKGMEERNILFAKRSSALPERDPGARFYLKYLEEL